MREVHHLSIKDWTKGYLFYQGVAHGAQAPLAKLCRVPPGFPAALITIFFGPTDQEEQQQQQLEGVRRVEEMDDRDVYFTSKNSLHNFW